MSNEQKVQPLSSSNSDESSSRKNYKKKHWKRRSEQNWSLSAAENHSENEEEGLTKRFYITNQEQQFQWKITPDMAKYDISYFSVFIQENDLNESILIQNPVPTNFQEVKRMDEYIVQLLKEKKSRRKIWMSRKVTAYFGARTWRG